ncbi:MAG TPA: hypothetical protein VJY33_20835, partial [Isosphaeraceae bacterium]|nr:hypothetical protein [Isosphaeraceae bacterium]
ASLDTLERDLNQLELEVGGVLDLGLGALRTSMPTDTASLPDRSLSPSSQADRVATRQIETT